MHMHTQIISINLFICKYHRTTS